VKLGREFIRNPIKITFEGGFAVDADFGDGFSGSIEGPKIIKKAVFSINPYSSLLGEKSSKSDRNFLEPSTFFHPGF
jgi:hypothetical protein